MSTPTEELEKIRELLGNLPERLAASIKGDKESVRAPVKPETPRAARPLQGKFLGGKDNLDSVAALGKGPEFLVAMGRQIADAIRGSGVKAPTAAKREIQNPFEQQATGAAAPTATAPTQPTVPTATPTPVARGITPFNTQPGLPTATPVSPPVAKGVTPPNQIAPPVAGSGAVPTAAPVSPPTSPPVGNGAGGGTAAIGEQQAQYLIETIEDLQGSIEALTKAMERMAGSGDESQSGARSGGGGGAERQPAIKTTATPSASQYKLPTKFGAGGKNSASSGSATMKGPIGKGINWVNS